MRQRCGRRAPGLPGAEGGDGRPAAGVQAGGYRTQRLGQDDAAGTLAGLLAPSRGDVTLTDHRWGISLKTKYAVL